MPARTVGRITEPRCLRRAAALPGPRARAARSGRPSCRPTAERARCVSPGGLRNRPPLRRRRGAEPPAPPGPRRWSGPRPPRCPAGAYLLRLEPDAAALDPAASVPTWPRGPAPGRTGRGDARERGAGHPTEPAPVRVAVALLTAYQGAASGRVSPVPLLPELLELRRRGVHASTASGAAWRLTARRLLRCRPFGPHGVDLVPVRVHAPRAEAARAEPSRCWRRIPCSSPSARSSTRSSSSSATSWPASTPSGPTTASPSPG